MLRINEIELIGNLSPSPTRVLARLFCCCVGILPDYMIQAPPSPNRWEEAMRGRELAGAESWLAALQERLR